MGNFKGSGRNNPCPVCSRTKDDSCRITDDLFVMCHSETTQKKGDEQSGYVFVGLSKDGGTWGMWKPKSEDWKAERPTGQEFKYPFYNADGNLVVTEVRTYTPDGKKKTWMEPSGTDTRTLLPYRYRDALAALENGAQHCVIAEGPPKAEALWAVGIPAVAFANGFKSGRDKSWFEGHETKLLVASDRDRVGIKKASDILSAYPMAKLLRPWPKSTAWDDEWIEDGGGRDVKDWIDEMEDKGMAKAAIADAVLAGVQVEARKTQEDVESYEWLIGQVRNLEKEHGLCSGKYDFGLFALSRKTKIPKPAIEAMYYKAVGASVKREWEQISQMAAKYLEDSVREWLIPGLLPRGTSVLLYADGGQGKTLFVYDMINCLYQKETFLNHRISYRPKTLLIQTDEPEIDLMDRMREKGMTGLKDLWVTTEWTFSEVKTLREKIISEGIELVVIDSFASANQNALTEEKDSMHAAVLYQLRNIANETNCTIIVLHHTNKAGKARGSTSIRNNVSEVWHLRSHNPEVDEFKMRYCERLFIVEKSRSGVNQKAIIELESEDLQWKYILNPDKAAEDNSGKPANFMEKVELYFTSNPQAEVTPLDLCDMAVMAGLKPDNAKKICLRLRRKGSLDITGQRGNEHGGVPQTIYTLSRVRDKASPIVPVQAEAVAGNDFQQKDNHQDSTGTSRDKEDRDSLDDGLSQTGTGVVPSSPVDCLGAEKQSANGLEGSTGTIGHADTPSREKDPLKDRFGKEKSEGISPLTGINQYSGPKVGAKVKFVLSPEVMPYVRRLKEKGADLPWGKTGEVSETGIEGRGYYAIVKAEGMIYVVKNLLAIEECR